MLEWTLEQTLTRDRLMLKVPRGRFEFGKSATQRHPTINIHSLLTYDHKPPCLSMKLIFICILFASFSPLSFLFCLLTQHDCKWGQPRSFFEFNQGLQECNRTADELFYIIYIFCIFIRFKCKITQILEPSPPLKLLVTGRGLVWGLKSLFYRLKPNK